MQNLDALEIPDIVSTKIMNCANLIPLRSDTIGRRDAKSIPCVQGTAAHPAPRWRYSEK